MLATRVFKFRGNCGEIIQRDLLLTNHKNSLMLKTKHTQILYSEHPIAIYSISMVDMFLAMSFVCGVQLARDLIFWWVNFTIILLSLLYFSPFR